MANARLEKALKEFEKAHKEYSAAVVEYKAANISMDTLLNKYDCVSLLKDHRPEIDAINETVKAALHSKKFSEAVFMAAGANVVDVACNIFVNAVADDPVSFSMPVDYKKFRKNFFKVLPESDFYFSNSYGVGLYIHFRKAPYETGSSWVFRLKNGCIDMEDKRERGRHESTLSEIKKEARRAFSDAEKLRKAVETLKGKDCRKKYNSHIRYYMPYLEVYAIHDDYKLF